MFKDIYDSGKNERGQPAFVHNLNEPIGWEEFVAILEAYSQVSFLSKDDAPLYAPTTYQIAERFKPSGEPYKGYRVEANATTSAMVVLDFDESPLRFAVARTWFEQQELEAVLYTTASNRTGDRFRIVVPLSDAVDIPTQKRTVRAVVRALGYDPDSTKMNPYSLFYVPGLYKGADNHFAHRTGEVRSALDWCTKYAEPAQGDRARKPSGPAGKPQVEAAIKQYASITDLKLSRDARWSFETHCQDRLGQYRSASRERRKGLYALGLSMAMSARNFGYDLSPGELAGFLDAEQRANPPTLAKNRYSLEKLNEVAQEVLDKAALYVSDPIFQKWGPDHMKWKGIDELLAEVKKGRAFVDHMMDDETAIPLHEERPAGDQTERLDPSGATQEEINGYPLYDAGRIGNFVPPRQWLLGNTFCRKFVSSISADGGTGKTALRVAQAMAVATGRPITGEHVFQSGRVLYLTLEDDKEEFDRRILACRMHHQIEEEKLAGQFFYMAINGPKLATQTRDGTEVGPLVKTVVQVIVQKGIDLVIFDPFIKSHSCGENDNNAIDFVTGILAQLAIGFNIAVDAPHHMAKGTADPGNAKRSRGASSFVDAIRLGYSLNRMADTDARDLGIDDQDRRGYVRVDSAKVNIAPPSDRATWFKLVGVQLHNQTEVYQNGDVVQTVEPWTPLNLGEIADEVILRSDIFDHIRNAPKDALITAHPLSSTSVAKLFRKYHPGIGWAHIRHILDQWRVQDLIEEDVEFTDKNRHVKKYGLRVCD
jgi:hypothetical protein